MIRYNVALMLLQPCLSWSTIYKVRNKAMSILFKSLRVGLGKFATSECIAKAATILPKTRAQGNGGLPRMFLCSWPTVARSYPILQKMRAPTKPQSPSENAKGCMSSWTILWNISGEPSTGKSTGKSISIHTPWVATAQHPIATWNLGIM